MTREEADTMVVRATFAVVTGTITEHEFERRMCWLGPVWWRLWRDEVLNPAREAPDPTR